MGLIQATTHRDQSHFSCNPGIEGTCTENIKAMGLLRIDVDHRAHHNIETCQANKVKRPAPTKPLSRQGSSRCSGLIVNCLLFANDGYQEYTRQ
jgi:hypothetical protein